MIFAPTRFSSPSMLFVAAMAGSATALAQTSPDPSAVLRNIEQSQPQSPSLPPIERGSAPATSSNFGITKLHSVRVESSFFPQEIQAYWLPFINKSVSPNEIARFKAWVWEQLQAEGFLAYVSTRQEQAPDGSVLVVEIRAPSLGQLTVATLDHQHDNENAKSYATEVARRFAKDYSVGSPVDVQGMTARLNTISYDLPVALEAVLRQPDAQTIDVVIQMRLLPSEPGKFISGLAQVNNYGLKAYGQEQVLTQLRFHGLSALSDLTLTGQMSSGVRYLKTEGMTPLVGLNSRGVGWFSWVDSESNGVPVERVSGRTYELGGGIHSLLSSDRDGSSVMAFELNHRSTDSRVARILQTDRTDNQVRLRLTTQKSPRWIENYSSELGLHLGQIRLNNPVDIDDRNVRGDYQKLEFNGQARKTLSSDKKWVLALRWRAQAASSNLDGYNQLSLGGVNGIRAYTSSDGVGDQGLQLSFDVTRQISSQLYAGFLFDTGRIKQNIQPVGGVNSSSYALSGAGIQIGGDVGSFNWTATAAKGLDKTEPFETAVSEELNEWRGSIAVNYRF